jgi:hypothetical protein
VAIQQHLHCLFLELLRELTTIPHRLLLTSFWLRFRHRPALLDFSRISHSTVQKTRSRSYSNTNQLPPLPA